MVTGENRFATDFNENEISWGCFNKTIVPLALVGYEMIIANYIWRLLDMR